MTDKNLELFQRAQKTIPGGVNSPARAFKSVGGNPLFIDKAEGAYLYDIEGKSYIDLINSWGPMILGHANEEVKKVLREQLEKSFSYGAPTEIEIKMAELVVDMVPGIDKIRMVNSGTEACFSAIRLARGFTKRDKIIKFVGNYHGHADSFLKKAGSGLATLGISTVPGVPEDSLKNTLLADFNNLPSVEKLYQEHGDQIAAIIVEPVAGNMGCIVPKAGFLEGLRGLCDKYASLLIFDEVMTGFRLAAGGAQEKLGVRADICTYGKVIGGGLPVGAFAARQEIMDHIAPVGSVYQAGTLSGNPLAMWSGFSQLSQLNNNSDLYRQLDNTTKNITDGLSEIFKSKSIPVSINRIGSMMSVHFTKEEVFDFESASNANQDHFSKYFHHMLDHGIYLPPSGFETWFVSTMITDKEVSKILQATTKFTL